MGKRDNLLYFKSSKLLKLFILVMKFIYLYTFIFIYYILIFSFFSVIFLQFLNIFFTLICIYSYCLLKIFNATITKEYNPKTLNTYISLNNVLLVHLNKFKKLLTRISRQIEFHITAMLLSCSIYV